MFGSLKSLPPAAEILPLLSSAKELYEGIRKPLTTVLAKSSSRKILEGGEGLMK